MAEESYDVEAILAERGVKKKEFKVKWKGAQSFSLCRRRWKRCTSR